MSSDHDTAESGAGPTDGEREGDEPAGVSVEARALEWLAHFDAIDAGLPLAAPSDALWRRLEAAVDAAGPLTVWRDLCAGVAVQALRPNAGDGGRAVAVRVSPGAAVPPAYAAGLTAVLVLEGAVDIDGRRIEAGAPALACAETPIMDLRSVDGGVFYARRAAVTEI